MGTVKYTGSVASFHCPTNAEIRSLKVHFSPKQEGSGDPSPENVRPIVGWDGVEVYRNNSTTDYEFGVLGKNKFNGTIVNQNIDSKGKILATDLYRLSSLYVPISSGTYTLSSAENYPTAVYVYKEDNDNSFITNESLISWNESPVTFTINEGKYISIKWKKEDGSQIAVSDISNIQLELGSTATEYEPYDPNHTVYGGWVDLISGEVCEEYKTIKATWGDFVLNNSTSYNDNYEHRKYTCDNSIDKSNGGSGFSNIAKKSWTDALTSSHFYIGNSAIHMFLPTGTSADLEVNIYVKLAESITYHITSTTLQTFLGQNNVWSNADYVEVEYDLHETQDILARKQFIVANQPHLVSPAAAPLQNFVTDMVAPLKECKVYFSPVQEGEGDPSPDNIRAISGWNEMTISQSQRQVIQDATNEDWTVGWLTAGGMLNASASYRTSDYIPVLSGTTVKIKFTNQTNERAWYCIAYYDSQKKFLIRNNQGYITEDITCTVSYEGLKYIRISINRASDVLISIEPITTYLIDWSSTGTVYGGYIDLLTGEVWKTLDIVSSSVLSDWLLNRTSLLYESGKAIRCYCPENGAGSTIKWTVQCTHFSDVGPVGNWAKDAERKDGYVVEAQGRSIMFIASDLGFTTKQEWAQWMVDNNVQYVYPLAAPVLITTLAPTQIKTLRGTNNIWSNSNGDITVQFWAH